VHILLVMRGNVWDSNVVPVGIVHAALIASFVIVRYESSWMFGEVWPAI
jgi:hypothetical protein